MKEERIDIKSGLPDAEIKKKNSLDTQVPKPRNDTFKGDL